MAILTTYFNLIMANETRRFEQKFAKIAKAGAANTPNATNFFTMELGNLSATGGSACGGNSRKDREEKKRTTN